MPVGTISGPHGKGMKRSTLGVRRSKLKVEPPAAADIRLSHRIFVSRISAEKIRLAEISVLHHGLDC